MKIKEIYNTSLGDIHVEKYNPSRSNAFSPLLLGLTQNRIMAGLAKGGQTPPFRGLTPVPPFLPPSNFCNTGDVFKDGRMINYYFANDIIPPFVSDDEAELKNNRKLIKLSSWKHFKALYYNALKKMGNYSLHNRKISDETDIRDFIKRYTNKEELELGFDTEWFNNDRDILSYQFSTRLDGFNYDIVFYPERGKRLKLGDMIYYIIAKVFAGRGFVITRELLDHHKKRIPDFFETCNVKLIAHFSGVDISMCSDYLKLFSYLAMSDKQSRDFYKYKRMIKYGTVDGSVNGACLSDDDLETCKERLKKIKEKPLYSHNLINTSKHCLSTTSPRMYNFWGTYSKNRCLIKISLRDTMTLSPPASPLAKLGESIGIPKLDSTELDKKDGLPTNYYKEHMDILLDRYPDFFHDYAVIDARISYEWYQKVKEIGGDGVTISAIAAKQLERNLVEEIEKYYKKVSWDKDVTGFTVKDGKPDYTALYDSRRVLGDMPDRAYIGGRNESFSHGLITGRTYDYDLRSAYPFQMQVMRMVDFEKPVITFRKGHKMSLNDWQHIGQPGFGYVHFKFPKYVKYPTIPLKSDKGNLKGTPVFLREGEGLVSAPDVFAALQVGAEVTVTDQGFTFLQMKRESDIKNSSDEDCCFNALDVDNDFIMHPVGFGVRRMIETRYELAQKYGKKSVHAQLWKIMVNSTYGKTGQGIHGNTARNILSDKTEVIPFSRITDPVIASTTTSLVRCCLGIIMNYIAEQGYTVHSVTTDGFISDFPWSRQLEIDEYLNSITPVYQKIIKSCWGETLDYSNGKGSILEVKHIQDEWFFNIKTRGNIGLDFDKEYKNPFTGEMVKFDSVFARAGYGGDKEFKFMSEYEQRKFLLDKVLTRNGRVIDYKTTMLSFNEVKKFDLKTVTNHYDSVEDSQKGLSLDYDKKRKLLPRKFSNVANDQLRSDYGYFETRPFENMEEYERDAVNFDLFIKFNHNIITDEDYNCLQESLKNGFPKVKVLTERDKRNMIQSEIDKHKLNYKKHEIKQFIIYLLKYDGINKESMFTVDDFQRKDFMKLIKDYYNIDAVEIWKSVKKRKHTTVDLKTGIQVFHRLHNFYINTNYNVVEAP